MKKMITILLLALSMPVASVAAEQANNESKIVVQKEQRSTFKGLLYSVWGKLRALSPQENRKTQRTVTAGVRGAETTDSLIDPYWKGDKTDDPDYIKELSEFNSAYQMAENGDLQGAVKAFSSFISSHSDSDLKPNAQFAMGISYGGMGQAQASVNTLNAFIKEYPNHPMVADARQVMAEMK